MSATRLLDSIFTRLVAWSIAISILVVLVLGALVMAKFEQMSQASAQRAVDADLAGLAEIFHTTGRGELVRRIGQRLKLPAPLGNAPHYMVVDNAGNRLAGDLSEWPNLAAEHAQTGFLTLPGGEVAYARAIRLDGETRLVAARQHRWDSMVLNEIGIAFVVGGIFVVFAVGVAGRMTAKRLARRVERINDAFREPDDQAMAQLEAAGQDHDEIGELTRHTSAALTRMRQLVTAQRETTDHVAHEIRTPLMHLDNRLFRALQATDDEDMANSLIDARREIRDVIAMLESLLDIATSEAQRGDRRGLKRIDVSQLAERIADLYAASAEETGHDFLCDIQAGVTVDGDEIQLTRMFANLLDNAFKYVPPGGSVKLKVLRGPVILVEDDGPGIPAEDRDRIFERFRRGDSGGRHKRGSGLGLTLARAIARRHGLEIRLVPSVRGARFEIRRDAAA